MRIGDAAEHLGLEAHVLRHWEDLGLLAPSRRASGHREYADADLDHARMIRRLQAAGMSLAEVHRMGTDRERRRDLVETHRRRLREQIDRLRAADAFLAHTLECQHPVITECEACAAFVRAP